MYLLLSYKKNSSFHDINRIVVKTSKYALYMHKITMDCQKNTVLINDMDFTCGQQKKTWQRSKFLYYRAVNTWLFIRIVD